MKKKYLLFALTLGLLTACDPIKDEADFDVTNLTSEQLLAGATFEQFDRVTNADGTTSYTANAAGNYIKYNIPSVPSVFIYYLNPVGGETQLSMGSSGGMFSFVPVRGADPVQTVYFRYVNQNGEAVVASKEFTLTPATELAPGMEYLVSDAGTKTWTWNTEAPNGFIWGNMGSDGSHSGEAVAVDGANIWWGVTTTAEFEGQSDHTEDDLVHPDQNVNATMVFNETGIVQCFDADGNQFRMGMFEIQNYDPDYSEHSAYCGILHTDAGSILFPYEINSGGNMPTDFQIAYLTDERLVLVYPDGGAWDGWSEGTFWQFKAVE